MPKSAEKNNGDFDHNQDRYPSIHKVLHAVSNADNLPNGPVERIEVTCLASGEATYRVWAARAEEPEGGYLPNVD